MAQWLSQKPDIAARSYDLIVAGYSQHGGTNDATWQALVDSRVQTVGLPRPSSLDQVREFTLLREVQKELKYTDATEAETKQTRKHRILNLNHERHEIGIGRSSPFRLVRVFRGYKDSDRELIYLPHSWLKKPLLSISAK